MPRRIMRVITRRATMLAGDWSQGIVEAYVRRSWVKAEARSVLRAFKASLVITRKVCIGAYSILYDFGAFTSFSAYTQIQSKKFEIAVIIAHLTWHFTNTSRPCTKKKNKKKKKVMLRCIVIGTCAVKFLHYVSLYRNTQHYTTLNCSIKTRLCTGGT